MLLQGITAYGQISPKRQKKSKAILTTFLAGNHGFGGRKQF